MQVLAAAFANQLVQVRVVIREVQEWSGRAEFLPLKKHRRLAGKQQNRRERAVSSRARQLVQPASVEGVRDLVVVLEIPHALMRIDVQRRSASAPLVKHVVLTLIQDSVLERRHELL